MDRTVWERVERAIDHWPGGLGPEAAAPWRGLVAALGATEPRMLWPRLCAHVHEAFGARGWAWNGIYERVEGEDVLRLRHAYGPPVCSDLERSGGVGSSGMCWDAVLRGETLWADPVSAWPGYVSCDKESGLSTRAGLVVPLRHAGRVSAVWDLDSTEPLRPEDPSLMTAVLACALEVSPWGA